MTTNTALKPSAASPTPRRRGIRVVLAVLAGLVLLPVVLVGGYAGYLKLSGTPFIDEWVCLDGWAPVDLQGGPGSECRKIGSELDEGDTWHPLGNRPYECHDRWGWREVKEVGAPADEESDCLAEGEPLPEGYRFVD